MSDIAGRTRHRIDFEEIVETRDDNGAVIESWVLHVANVPCEIVTASVGNTSGGEQLLGDATHAFASYKFTCRSKNVPLVNEKMRVSHLGVKYNIVSINQDPTFQKFVSIIGEAGKRDG